MVYTFPRTIHTISDYPIGTQWLDNRSWSLGLNISIPVFNGYITKNLPWLLRGKVNVSSYYGYDPHLASEFKYRLTNRIAASDQPDHGLIFVPSVDWLKKTGLYTDKQR